MSKSAFYNGILYQIEYQPQLSNSDYTQHKVYHIKTEDELGYKQGEIWNKGLYQLKNDREVIVDVYGRTIVLGGQHTFEWSITIYTRERIVKTTYPNGREVRKEFYKYKRKK